MKHPESVDGMKAEELAKKFMNTTYEYHLNFFKKLTELYKEESKKDGARGYKQLSSLLHFASIVMKRVWKVCKPHMGE